MAVNKANRRQRIKYKIRKTISGTATTPRLTVFRSNADIYVQLVDDKTGKTIASFGSNDKSMKSASGTKSDKAKMVGKAIAEKAQSVGISSVAFDRNGYLYHGRVKALAEGAREGGLKF